MHLGKSFSIKLLRNFLISTFIPFVLVTAVIAITYTQKYRQDTSRLLDSAVNAIAHNISAYLTELEQVTLLPYYNDNLYYYLKMKSMTHDTDIDILEKIPLQQNLNSNISFVRYTREDINGIFITTPDQCIYYTVNHSDRTRLAEDYSYADQSWYQQALSADGRALTIGPHNPDYIIPSYDNQVISVVRSIVVLETREPLYVIKIDVNAAIFEKSFKDFYFHVDSKIIITDEQQSIIYSNKKLQAKAPQVLALNYKKGESIHLHDGTWNIYSYPIGQYPWQVKVLLSTDQLNTNIRIICLLAVILYLIGLITAFLFYIHLSKRLVISVDKMKEIFKSVQEGDLSMRYSFNSDTELDHLGTSLNTMIVQLDERIKREYIMTIRQKEMEFNALQAQIQPHFLFNTLNSFIALNQAGERQSLEDSLFTLSEMLRYILRAPSIISLETELHFIRGYCSLQKLRFNDRLNYQIITDVDAANIYIPKLLLQPIVENSILHGLEPCCRVCTIQVSCQYRGQAVEISITDDGQGFSLEDLQLNESIGLNNVKERLLTFSADSTFIIQSEPDTGTAVILCIPLPKEDLLH